MIHDPPPPGTDSLAPEEDQSTPGTRRRRLEPEDRRRQILSCAVRLFGEHGYDEVSLADVAGEAGVARGLVNHYFGTKKDLYLEVVRVLATFPDNAVPAPTEGDLEVRIEGAVTWFLDAVSRHIKTWLGAVATSGPGLGSEVARVVADADEATVDHILQLANISSERQRDERVRAALRSYVYFARAGAVEWLVRESLTRDQVHLLLSKTLLRLLDGTIDLEAAA